MATLGEVMVNVGADVKEFEKNMNNVDKTMKEVTQDMKEQTGDMSKAIDNLAKNSGKSFQTMEEKMNHMRDVLVAANDKIQAKGTAAGNMIKNLERLNSRPWDRQALKLAAALDAAAKKGQVLNVAINEVGRNADFKTLMSQIRLINLGLARFQALSMAAAITFAAFTYVMYQAAKGPNVGEVLQKQADLMKQYTDALKQREQDIYDFAGLFEKVSLKTNVTGKQLTKNLEGQVTVMRNWSKNLKVLAKRGVDEGLIQELQKMGPAAGAEIAALVRMSDKELNKYVALWREKHRLARTQSLSELEKMKQETADKIKELSNSLTSLGIAVEKFKKTWAEALAPFVKLWGDLAAHVVDAFTRIGEFVKKLNSISPLFTQLGGMFLYVFNALLILLAPLAIGISRAGSMAAAFNVLWMAIKPLVTGFLAVAGTAAIWAAAIVAVGYALYKLWTESDGFRNAVQGLWDAIKNAWLAAFAPLLDKFSQLKAAFLLLFNALSGGKDIGSFWDSLGDTIGTVLTTLGKVLIPLVSTQFKVMSAIIGGVIDVLVAIFMKLSAYWTQYGGQITGVVKVIWGYIQQAFSAVGSFIKSIMPSIVDMIGSAFNFIKTVITTVMPIILAIVVPVFKAIWSVIQFVMPAILWIIQGVWENIKAVITSAISIITNIFQFFTNILTGNFSGAWENVKNIFSSALTFIWNFIQLALIGRALKGILAFGRLLIASGRAAWQGFLNIIRSNLLNSNTTIGSFVTRVISGFRSLSSVVMSIFRGIGKFMTDPIGTAKAAILKIIDLIKGAFARMNIKIPRPKLPKITVTRGETTIGGVPVPYPKFSLEWFAKGGIIDGASIVGVGEAGAEQILPIENKRRMKPYANMVADLLSERQGNQAVSAGDIIIHIAQMIVREEADIQKIAQELHRIKQIKERAGGVQYGY